MRQWLFILAAATILLSAGLQFWLLSVVFTDTIFDWHHHLLGCFAPGHVDSEISPSSMWKDCIELIKTLVWQTVKIRFRGEGIVSELVLPHKPHVVSSEVAPAVLLTPQASTLYFFTSVAARRLRVSVSAAAALIGEHKCCCHSGGWHTDWFMQDWITATQYN